MSTQLRQALQKIAEKYDSEIFFKRLRQYGIVPQNDAEATDLIKLTVLLKQGELSQLIARAVQQTTDISAQQHLSMINEASAETLNQNPELRKAFAIAVQGPAEDDVAAREI